MKRVILTVGMRGAGKTTFCNKVKQQHPTVGLISWDRWYKENFPDWKFDAYSGEGPIATEILWSHIADVLSAHRHPLIIDRWLPEPERRTSIVAKLYSLGADWVTCWHFVTPPKLCCQRFAEREFDSKTWRNSTREYLLEVGQRDNSFFRPVTPDEALEAGETNKSLNPRWDFRRYRFDEIVTIDPHQLIFPGMPLI